MTAMFCGLVTFRLVGSWYSPHRIASEWPPAFDWGFLFIAIAIGSVISLLPTMAALWLLNRLNLKGVHWYVLAGVAICVTTWTALFIPFDADQIGWMLETKGKAMSAAGGVAGLALWLFLRPDAQAAA